MAAFGLPIHQNYNYCARPNALVRDRTKLEFLTPKEPDMSHTDEAQVYRQSRPSKLRWVRGDEREDAHGLALFVRSGSDIGHVMSLGHFSTTVQYITVDNEG